MISGSTVTNSRQFSSASNQRRRLLLEPPALTLLCTAEAAARPSVRRSRELRRNLVNDGDVVPRQALLSNVPGAVAHTYSREIFGLGLHYWYVL